MPTPVLFLKSHPALYPGPKSRAQAEAGNYAKRRISWRGLTLRVENEAGTVREGNGWQTRMVIPYGEIEDTLAVDGDRLDVYIGPDLEAATHVYVIEQRRAGRWSEYDEPKCMLGFLSEESAAAAYLQHYDDARFMGGVTAMPVDEFVARAQASVDDPSLVKSWLGGEALLKATVKKMITVPGYVKTDGTWVPPHQKAVHYNADHDLHTVAHGGVSHSQKQAHAKLSKHDWFQTMPAEDKAAHVMSHATDIQEAASASAAVTYWKAAAKAGKNPSAPQWAAFQALPAAKKAALYDEVSHANEGSLGHLKPPEQPAEPAKAEAPAAPPPTIADLEHAKPKRAPAPVDPKVAEKAKLEAGLKQDADQAHAAGDHDTLNFIADKSVHGSDASAAYAQKHLDNLQAKEKLAAIAKGDAPHQQKEAFKKLAADPAWQALDGDFSAKLAAVMALYKQLQGAASHSAAISMWKKAVLAGKYPSAAQAAAFKKLNDTDPKKAWKLYDEVVASIGHAKMGELMAGSEVPSPQAATGPQEGDTKPGADGGTLVLQNGHWVKQGVDASALGASVFGAKTPAAPIATHSGKPPAQDVPAYDYIAKNTGADHSPKVLAEHWLEQNPDGGAELSEALQSLGYQFLAANMDLPAPDDGDADPAPATPSGKDAADYAKLAEPFGISPMASAISAAAVCAEKGDIGGLYEVANSIPVAKAKTLAAVQAILAAAKADHAPAAAAAPAAPEKPPRIVSVKPTLTVQQQLIADVKTAGFGATGTSIGGGVVLAGEDGYAKGYANKTQADNAVAKLTAAGFLAQTGIVHPYKVFITGKSPAGALPPAPAPTPAPAPAASGWSADAKPSTIMPSGHALPADTTLTSSQLGKPVLKMQAGDKYVQLRYAPTVGQWMVGVYDQNDKAIDAEVLDDKTSAVAELQKHLGGFKPLAILQVMDEFKQICIDEKDKAAAAQAAAEPDPAPAATPEPAPAITVNKIADVFHNTNPGHSKQWSVSVHGKELVTSYGPIGKTQQKTVKVYPSSDDAVEAKYALIKEKTGKGYQDTHGSVTHEHSTLASQAAGAHPAAPAPAPAAAAAPAKAVGLTADEVKAAIPSVAQTSAQGKELIKQAKAAAKKGDLAGVQAAIDATSPKMAKTKLLLGALQSALVNKQGAADGPKDGDTKQGADGMLVFKDGHWHKVPQAKVAKPLGFDAINAAKAASYGSGSVNLTNQVSKDAAKMAAEGDLAGIEGLLANPVNYAGKPKGKAFLEALHAAMTGGGSTPAASPPPGTSAAFVASATGVKPAPAPAPAPAAPPKPAPSKSGNASAPKIVSVQELLAASVSEISGWKKVGGQQGSNEGGTFKDGNGVEWYCKFPKNAGHAASEILASKLYAAAGLDVPELKAITLNGKAGIASRVVPLKQDAAGIGGAAGMKEGFVVDAWLANWDVVGPDFTNTQLQGKKAFRVDVGGALEYRAQGTKKTDFGAKVLELDSLRDPAKNASAAKVFGGMTDAQIASSARNVFKLSDDSIRKMVMAYGPGSVADKTALAATLIARKADLMSRFPQVAADYLPKSQVVIPAAPNFKEWKGPGEGLSSKAHVNQQNQDIANEIYGLGAAGNVKELKDLHFQPLDKDTGAPQGAKQPINAHPSGHVKKYHADVVHAAENPVVAPSPLVEEAKIEIASGKGVFGALIKAFDDVKALLQATHKLGRYAITGKVEGGGLFDGWNVEEKSKANGKLSAKKMYDASHKGYNALTSVEKQAIKDYTGSGYASMNNAATGVGSHGKTDYAIGGMNKASVELEEGTVLSRKFSFGSDADLKNMLQSEGCVLKDFGIISTSMSPHVWSGNVHLRITTAPGCKGLYVAPDPAGGGGAISNFPGEDEVILPYGTKFFVKKVHPPGTKFKDAHGNWGTGGPVVELVALPADA